MLGYLPITAAIAIILFVVKEGLEFYRRKSAEKREVSALKLLISHELQRNHWSVKTLKKLAVDIRNAISEENEILIEVDTRGNERVKFVKDGLGCYSAYPITRIHNEYISRNLTKMASLDKNLFSSCVRASEALTELRHVRDSAIEHISTKEFLDGYADWAEEEIDAAMRELDNTYRLCTGKELSNFRVR